MKTRTKFIATKRAVKDSAVAALRNGVSLDTVKKQLVEHNIIHPSLPITRDLLIQLLEQA